ncbi:M1 family peptidase [Pseudoduganella sp. FT93W]|uniref:Aminopeptidase n=1 Tax=Duganella fentianensis TaxID=2692177 RepID=A0A845I2Z3_9BURK|nr:M1 family metallopeptidase [Duganella fentianensis]MYN45486.1 M1 family peptidase [Duganella fentianensis]
MQRTLISLAVMLALASTLPASAQAAAAKQTASAPVQTTTQLPRNAVPSHYAVSLVPDAAQRSFSASVTIALDVVQASDSLTLHAADLSFRGAAISAGPGQTVLAADHISIDAKTQTVTLHFPRTLAKGGYQLKLDYDGKISTQASGLFSLDYENGGAKKRALYTQFENSDARAMIPSWDEPAYKATFTLEATIPAGQMAVSNMPVSSTSTLADGRQLVRFATSPKMSTYLLFFAMGEFDRASKVVDGTELGIITQKGMVSQGQFALDSSVAVLKEYNDYFGVKYPLPKLDNIGAPGSSQSFSAMENWGAIFTFENAILLDPRIATQDDQQTSFLVAAHEMAHQWFGDLVTMAWWDDLWLNEGFASWMESRTTNRLHPEWQWSLRAVDTREQAMGQDALATTHPVVQKIATVEQASQAFDSITYQKGEAVIRMLEDYVGEQAWRSGVRNYMAKHKYGNTVSDDLWRAVEQAAHKPVTAIAHDFTLQPGVPMIRVAAASCSKGQTRVTLTQEEFSKDQPDKQPLRWRVPVIAQTVGGAPVRTLVSNGKASVTLPGCGAVLVNAGQTGYYRTLYAPQAFASLASQFRQLPTIDQLGLLGDSRALGMAGQMPASSALDLASNAAVDAAPQVWNSIAGVLLSLHGLYEGKPDQQAALDRYGRQRLAPVLAHLGWQARAGESSAVANLRETLVVALGAMGDESVTAEARRRFAAVGHDARALPPELRRPILGVLAENADTATWEQLHKAAQDEPTPMIKAELYGLLGMAKDVQLARRALELALADEGGVTTSAAIVGHVAGNHPDMAYDYSIAHYAEFEKKVDASARSRYFARLGGRSSDPAMLDKLRAYAGKYLAPEAQGDTNMAIAAIQYRIKVRTTRLPEIDAWLAKHP